MRLTLIHGACVLGLATIVSTACNKSNDRPTVSAAEQRRIDERRAEERRLEERRAEERKSDAEERKAERRADERRAEERLAEERRADDRNRREPRLANAVDPAIRATPASAVTSLATERCDREVRCKNIGAKEKYKTRADCIAEMERDKRDDINSDVCRGGIRQKELADCVNAIRDESCGNPLDAITRLAACRTGNLCAK
ncbi:MAG TPA: DUF6184 family natural product biosynthesis lipoprotein [Polyangiaceae bacterium]|nr:DUF6184 family natural product biosynthesis lipoprotein [Polyangiaceae bacterium]